MYFSLSCGKMGVASKDSGYCRALLAEAPSLVCVGWYRTYPSHAYIHFIYFSNDGQRAWPRLESGGYCNAAFLLFVFINYYFIQFHYHFIILIVLLFCCLSNVLL